MICLHRTSRPDLISNSSGRSHAVEHRSLLRLRPNGACRNPGARFIVSRLAQRRHTTTLIDPLEYPLPLLDKMYKEYTSEPAPEVMRKLAEIIKAADAFVIVSGEYNHSIPPALSNMLDHFLEEWFFRPSAIVCYSNRTFGGVRAAVHLRAVLAELGMSSIPSIFPIPSVAKSFAEDGTPLDERFDRRIVRFIDELEWYANALKEARNNGVPY